MRFCTALVVSLATILGCPPLCDGAPILTLSTANPSPLSIRIGEQVTFNVNLSGLETGEELDSLAATILFDAAAWSVPAIEIGPATPNPLADPSDLLTVTDTGLVDYSFLTLGTEPAHHIQDNGRLFSFTVEARSAAEGEFTFDFVDSTAFNSTNPDIPIALGATPSGPLQFGVVVPEPATASLLVLAMLFAVVAARNTSIHHSHPQ